MSNIDLDAVVILSVAELLGVDPSDINLKSSFRDDLGADSLDLVEIVTKLEKEFNIEISDEDAQELNTVEDVCDFLYKRFPVLPEKALKIVTREKEIRQELKDKKPMVAPDAVLNEVPISHNLLFEFKIRFAANSAFALIALLSIYYIIIFAHWDSLFHWLILNGWVMIPNLALFAVVVVSLVTVPVYGKGMAVSLGLISVLTISLYSVVILIALVITATIGFSKLTQAGLDLLRSSYLSQYHSFWLVLVNSVFYIFVFREIKDSGRIFAFIDSFKTFPLLSPVFCFGAPVFWKSSLIILGITTQSIKLLSIISFVSGTALLLGLIIFYVFVHPETIKDKDHINVIVPESVIIQRRHKYSMISEQISLILLLAGVGALTYVVFEIAYLALIS